jgi:hypothetical protein
VSEENRLLCLRFYFFSECVGLTAVPGKDVPWICRKCFNIECDEDWNNNSTISYNAYNIMDYDW